MSSSDSHRARSTQHTIVGIDPGLHRTGYAILSEHGGTPKLRDAGVIRIERQEPLHVRLAELSEGVDAILKEWRPDAMTCEELYSHYRHPRTAILMGHARGVILARAAANGLKLLGVSATRAKKTLTGHGRATKEQMQRAVAMALRLPVLPEPHDVADAIAIGLCGLLIRREGALVGGSGAER
jgi:crossover junction endodeoxyribonuclease RuvC